MIGIESLAGIGILAVGGLDPGVVAGLAVEIEAEIWLAKETELGAGAAAATEEGMIEESEAEAATETLRGDTEVEVGVETGIGMIGDLLDGTERKHCH